MTWHHFDSSVIVTGVIVLTSRREPVRTPAERLGAREQRQRRYRIFQPALALAHHFEIRATSSGFSCDLRVDRKTDEHRLGGRQAFIGTDSG